MRGVEAFTGGATPCRRLEAKTTLGVTRFSKPREKTSIVLDVGAFGWPRHAKRWMELNEPRCRGRSGSRLINFPIKKVRLPIFPMMIAGSSEVLIAVSIAAILT
ncbi:MAG: hypothetical protein RL077_1239 [Verrucomicrobiota bacterium]